MNGAAQLQGGPAGDWQVPAATRPVLARLALPGSKSMTNRALVLAALADGPTRITGPLRARDTALMASALRELGSVVEDEPAQADASRDQTGRDETGQDETGQADAGQAGSGWRVVPGRCGGTAEVDVGNAGTVMRFLPGVAAPPGAA